MELNKSLIIFPRYQRHRSFECHLLSKARIGLALMEHLINARNLLGHGLAEAARIAGCIPAYRMNYFSFEQLIHKLGCDMFETFE